MKKINAVLMSAWQTIIMSVSLRDVFVFGGTGIAAFGVGQIYTPAAWITIGLVLFGIGLRG